MPLRIHFLILSVLMCCRLPAGAQPHLERAVGLVLSQSEAKLHRAGFNFSLDAVPGDVLFAGDSLATSPIGHAEILFCPAHASRELTASSEVLFQRDVLRLKSGSLSDPVPAEFCDLPILDRVSIAANRHYGASVESVRTDNDSLATHISRLAEDLRDTLTAELARCDRAIAANPRNLPAHISRAIILEKYGLNQDAMAEHREILRLWSGAVWAFSRIFLDGEGSRRVVGSGQVPRRAAGKTYALLIGISKYSDSRVVGLDYAHADAELFDRHLRMPRGGLLTDSEISLLTNEKARLPDIRAAIATLLRRKAGKDDTVLLFFAAHGTSTEKDGYILAHESNPENLADTALPMSEINTLFEEKLKSVGHVLLYVDACHAGMIGTIRANGVEKSVTRMAEDNEIFGLLASRQNEIAKEGLEYGGHGAFSRYLVEALSGDAADTDGDRAISATEVFRYVINEVYKATQHKQNPKEIGNATSDTILAKLDDAGLDIRKLFGTAAVASMEGGGGGRGVSTPFSTADQGPSTTLQRFDEELRVGRLLPGGESAFVTLDVLRNELTPLEFLEQENRLRAALENRGQEVLLRYLKGEQARLTRNDFQIAADYFAAARQLTPESLLIRAREYFCLGRIALYDRDYARGIALLQRSARLDAPAAFPYNALGIAYLELADYATARLAFLDAIQRAPYWAYPRHNLAVALLQAGEYDQAIAAYKEAMKRVQEYAYLPYNLGLIYQKINRRHEAESAFKSAMKLDPELADPYNALGYLNAARGRSREAERLYREALAKDEKLVSARQNLAVLLWRQPARAGEALDLWRSNLKIDPSYLPTLLSLAKALDSRGDNHAAIGYYRQAACLEPRYAGVLRALAILEMKVHRYQDASADLEAALDLSPRDAELLELKGDLENEIGNRTVARLSYQQALDNFTVSSMRRRIHTKLKRIGYAR